MPARRALAVAPTTGDDAALEQAALEEALERVRELSLRLWAVRGVHRPRRSLLGVRCGSCGQPHPCLTLRAVESPSA